MLSFTCDDLRIFKNQLKKPKQPFKISIKEVVSNQHILTRKLVFL